VQPANIAVTLRRRSPWEAIDLGLAMLQRWWRNVYVPHLLAGGAIAALALALAWAAGKPWLALVLIWWLKPVYDRVVLHVLSRAVFGERPGTRAVLAAAPDWLGTGLLAALTLGRFDLARSFNLAVRQLERQKGRAGRERRRLLGRRARGYAVWLTVVCLHFEAVLYWSLGLLGEIALPAKSAEGSSVWELIWGNAEPGAVWSYGDAAVYALAVLAFEPFYVAAGFALYLNRRTLLEGWDIEVALRRIAERHAAAGMLAGIFIFIALLVPPPVQAQAAQKDPKSEIQEVLKSPDFGQHREVMRWRSRNPSPEAKPFEFDWTSLRAIGYALAKVAELVFWLAAAAAVAYAAWYVARRIRRGDAIARDAYSPPPALFGMQLAPESLPADVPEAAAALAREGRPREALGLLYRGALSDLVHRRGVELLASHTELEALAVARVRVPQPAGTYLEMLVDSWRQSAYARRDPTAADILQLAVAYRTAFA
jgi:hypothetical protein